MESGSAILFTSVHSSFSGFSFAIPSDTIYIYQWFSGILFRSKNRLPCFIVILRTKQEPFFLTEVALFVGIKSTWNYYKSIPTTVRDTECPGHIPVAHIETTPAKRKTTF